MEVLSKVSRSLIIGCIMGLATALFTNFFFKPLIDRLENQTYDMRYVWEFGERFNPTGNKTATDDFGSGIHIIDIDDRSLQKLGVYWHWDRSYHAQLIESISTQFPAALVFDVLFYDPEDHLYAERLDNLLLRSKVVNPDIHFSDNLRRAIVSTINYDKRFVQKAKELGNVYFGCRMSNRTDYPDHAFSQIQHKTTMAWHDSLKPSSTIAFPPSLRKQVVFPGKQKPVIDGIFPRLAQAAKAIGYVNVVPDDDGTIRTMPVFFAFGDNQPIYLPLSIRVAASLFATPTNEIHLEPGKYLDIGRPLKIFCDDAGELSCSYPHLTMKQIRELISHQEAIRNLEENESIEISSFLAVGKTQEGERYASMYAGDFPSEVLAAFDDSLVEKKVSSLEVGASLRLKNNVLLNRDSEFEWTLSAPYGDQEWWLSTIEIRTLAKVTESDFDDIAAGKKKLVFYPLTVRRAGGKLVTPIPVLRGKTLTQLCRTPWDIIADIQPGSKMEFGPNVRIPVGKNNNHIITFFGLESKPFPYYSYYDIMKGRIKGNLEGKIFVVGSTLPDLFDIKPVPHDNTYPAVEIHASLLHSFLTRTFTTRLAMWQNFLILLLVSIVIGFVSLMLKPLHGAILSLLTVFGYFLVAMMLFGTYHLWIDIARPVLAIVITFTGVMAYRYVTEEKDRKFLQTTFKQYLSPELIDMMYTSKQIPKLGGDEGVRTAFFTDIQSFSTFSEKLGSPTRLVELLNEYLTAMTDILLAHYGTLDKYEGDAIIAFFGAPMAMDDHAHQACLTALDMQKKLGELREKWASEGEKWPKIVHDMRMRIGINSGAIMTGNMGSKLRMNYTMMGDAVNLAARLESAAKQYGVYTMFSQSTHELVKNDFETRQLDKITVVGKSEPVVVYELLGKKGELKPETEQLVETYRQGLELFYSQKWDEAIEVLRKSEDLEQYRHVAPKNMSPSTRVIQYCEMYKASPPGADWDGVIRLTSK